MEREKQNVAIVLTPPGAAAIAVVRLSGPRTLALLRSHFSKEAREGRCVHSILRDGSAEIDDPVVVLLPGGHGADINCHGGTWVVHSVLELARRAGFSVIESLQAPLPIEAVDGESEIEREVLAYLPLARTELGVRTLLAQPAAWTKLERDLAEMPADACGKRIDTILADRSLHRLLHPPRVAIVGAPNVGKSTLANQLFGQERSITADLPGTTRDWVGDFADINGLPILLIDTPGQRQTSDPIEHAAIQQSQDVIAEADLIILLLDATRPDEPEQKMLIEQYRNALHVLNKIDQLHDDGAWPSLAIRTIATSGAGLEELRERIASHFGCKHLSSVQPQCWTERQRIDLRQR